MSSFSKETYNLIDPTKQSHPIVERKILLQWQGRYYHGEKGQVFL